MLKFLCLANMYVFVWEVQSDPLGGVTRLVVKDVMDKIVR
jgi:hypothetical protein